jgi:hypothetical protein
MLHASFAVAVLSDLFGIQARSGCFCAGPYIHRMYPIDDAWSERMHAEARQGHLGAKLAFTRLSFNYYISEAEFHYVLDAVHLVADEGWKLLPLYRFDPDTGMWRHRRHPDEPSAGLRDVLGPAPARFPTAPEGVLAHQLAAARRIIADVEAFPPADALLDPPLTEDFERIRWFTLPSEGLAHVRAR